MKVAVDLRSLMGGRISGVENYLINILQHLPAEHAQNFFGFANSFSDPHLPQLNPALKVVRTTIPNKILNAGQVFLKFPKLEGLYGGFETLWMPDLRPFAIKRKTRL